MTVKTIAATTAQTETAALVDRVGDRTVGPNEHHQYTTELEGKHRNIRILLPIPIFTSVLTRVSNCHWR